MAVLNVTKNLFESQIKTSDRIVLLDFYADWCGPCNMVAPILAKVAEENPDYCIGKVNVDDEPELARQFGVTTIPTLVVLDKGQVIRKSVGSLSKAKLEALLKG